MNFLHIAEKWEVCFKKFVIIAVYTVATRFLKKFFQDDHFVPFTCDDIKVDIRPEHRCSTKKDSKISMKMVSLASSVSVSIHCQWDVSESTVVLSM